MFAKIENNKVVKYPITGLQQELPNTSLPANITIDNIPSGYVIIEDSAVPVTDALHKVQEVLPEKVTVGGVVSWKRKYSVVPLSAEELATKNTLKAFEVRQERDAKLAASDWTQLPDSGANVSAWAAYRQGLRDITSQPGFPLEVTWPIAPV